MTILLLALFAAAPLVGLGIALLLPRRRRGREPSGGPPPGLLASVLAALAVPACLLLLPQEDAPRLWLGAGLGWVLLALAAWDLRCGLLPDRLTLPLLLAGLAATALFAPARLEAHLLGAAAGFLSLAALRALYRLLRGREGLGLGDAKLLAAGGAWLGWEGLASVVLLGCATAALSLLPRHLAGHRLSRHSALAFGPWLALGIWLVWLLGPLTLAGATALD